MRTASRGGRLCGEALCVCQRAFRRHSRSLSTAIFFIPTCPEPGDCCFPGVCTLDGSGGASPDVPCSRLTSAKLHLGRRRFRRRKTIMGAILCGALVLLLHALFGSSVWTRASVTLVSSPLEPAETPGRGFFRRAEWRKPDWFAGDDLRKSGWNGRSSRAPLLIMALLFGGLVIIDCVALAFAWGGVDARSAEIVRFILIHLIICTTGLISYISDCVYEEHYVVRIVGGDHHVRRHWHWLVSSPLQWYVFCTGFTTGTKAEFQAIYIWTLMMQIAGICQLHVVSPVIQAAFFSASSVAHVIMFALVFRLPLRYEVTEVAKLIRVLMLVVWTAAPIVMVCRCFGLISIWFEQVVGYSVVDCCAKCITLSTIVLVRLACTVSSIDGTLQLASANHDFIAVVDTNFSLIGSMRSIPIVAPYFDLTNKDLSLLQLCINDEHRQRFVEAAHAADKATFESPSPKCCVTFCFRQGKGEAMVECVFSRIVRGSRIIGISVTGMSGPSLAPEDTPTSTNCSRPPASPSHASTENPCATNLVSVQAQDQKERRMGDRRLNQQISRSRLAPNTASCQMQLRLSLHNCTDVLNLEPEVSAMIADIFMQSDVACCLTVCDVSAEVPEVTVVAGSPRFAFYFNVASLPTNVKTILPADNVENIRGILPFRGLHAYRQSGVSLVQGTLANVTALPLNRLSAMADETTIQLSILIFEGVEGQGLEDAKNQVFTYSVGNRLHHLLCDIRYRIISPVLYVGQPEMHDPVVWGVLFEELHEVPDQHLRAASAFVGSSACRRPIYVIPRHDVDPHRCVLSGQNEEGYVVLRAESKDVELILSVTGLGRLADLKEQPSALISSLVSLPSARGYVRKNINRGT